MRGALIGMAVGVLLTACSSPPEAPPLSTPAFTTPTPARTIGEWKRRNADQFAAVTKGLLELSGAIQDNDLPAVRIGCVDLRAASDNLERALPTPDPAVDVALHDMINSYRASANLGITINGGNSLDETNHLLTDGVARMNDAYSLMGMAAKPAS